MGGLAATRVIITFVTVIVATKGLPGRSGLSSFFSMLICSFTFGLLLPWGPDLLFFPLVSLILLSGASFSRKRSPDNIGEKTTLAVPAIPALGYALLIAWPSLDRNFWLGAIIFSLMAGFHEAPSGAGHSKRALLAALALLAPLVNPAGFHSTFNGEAFVPLLASWIGHPGFSFTPPGSPAFWLVFIPLVFSLYRGWGNPAEISVVAISASAALSLKTMIPLPSLLLLTSQARSEEGTSPEAIAPVPVWRRGYLHAVFIPFILWCFLDPPAISVPPEARAALSSIPAPTSVVLTEPAWRTEVEMWVGPAGGKSAPRRVQPAMKPGDLLAYREKYPALLHPPFLLEPEPAADIVLSASRYPEPPFPRELQAGWHLVSAGNEWALFCRENRETETWLEQNSLKAYSPYLPLPTERPQMEAALGETRRLIENDPLSVLALRDAGKLEAALGMLPEAEEHLSKALQLRYQDADTWNELGMVFQSKGQVEEAVRAYTNSINLAPLDVPPRLNLADLYMSVGKAAEAEALLADILAKRPAYGSVRRMLAKIFMMQGRFYEAAELIRAIPVEQRVPEDSQFLAPGAGQGGAPQ